MLRQFRASLYSLTASHLILRSEKQKARWIPSSPSLGCVSWLRLLPFELRVGFPLCGTQIRVTHECDATLWEGRSLLCRPSIASILPVNAPLILPLGGSGHTQTAPTAPLH